MNNAWIKTAVFCAVFMGLSVGIGLYALGVAQSAHSGAGLTVTGSVKQAVTADMAKWIVNLSRRSGVADLKSAIAGIESDKAKLKNFVTKFGLDAATITFLPIQTSPIYEQIPNYGYTQNIIGYNVTEEVRVQSSEIDKVEKLSTELGNLVNAGIVPDYQRTEYYFTKLNEMRPQLFALATADAKVRAEAIARGSGGKVGDIASARTGVIQVMAPNSIDVSDYGSYDLSTKDKEISATVSVTFKLK